MTKPFGRKMQFGQAQWKFESQRTWSPHMISDPTNLSATFLKADEGSDDPLRAIVDACVSNVAVLDESGNILYSSRAWRLFQQAPEPNGFDVEPYYFENCSRFTESEFEEDTGMTLADDLRQIMFGEEREFHHQYHCPSVNRGRPFLMHAARLNLPGASFRVLITHEDSPAPREDLQNTMERWTQLLETTKVMAWEGEVEGQRFTYVSEQAEKMLGYPISAWYKLDFLASHIHPDDRQRVLSAYHKQCRVAEHFDLTFRMLGSDDRVAWVENLVSVMPDSGPGSRRMHGFMIDISERKHAEEALKYLGSRLIVAQEEERKRVARELHDDLNQRMAVLTIELEQLDQSVEKSLKVHQRLQKLRRQAQEISTDIHRLAYRLHPSKLEHLGLAAAVKSLCDELSGMQTGKPKVHFHQTGLPADLSRDVTLCLFRIAQEGLRNCVKHSGAEFVQVVLRKTDHAIRLFVSDNGCGFNARSEAMEKGLGFISMQERLRLVGGEIKIFSQPRRGTRLEVSIPLKLSN